jgi:hypothetical protein
MNQRNPFTRTPAHRPWGASRTPLHPQKNQGLLCQKYYFSTLAEDSQPRESHLALSTILSNHPPLLALGRPPNRPYAGQPSAWGFRPSES